MFGGEKKTIK